MVAVLVRMNPKADLSHLDISSDELIMVILAKILSKEEEKLPGFSYASPPLKKIKNYHFSRKIVNMTNCENVKKHLQSVMNCKKPWFVGWI